MKHSTTLRHLAASTMGVTADSPGRLRLVVERGAPLNRLLQSGLVPDDAVLLLDGGDAATTCTAHERVLVDGTLRRAGDLLRVSPDLMLEAIDVRLAPFLTVHGPSVLQVGTEEDLLALVGDATTAAETGVFPSLATSPLVQLADLPVFGGWPTATACALRGFLGADGSLRVGPRGAVLADLDEVTEPLSTVLDPALVAGTALGGVVSNDALTAALAAAPALPRYLAVVGALRVVRSHGRQPLGVSGWAHLLDEGLGERGPAQAPDQPVLISTHDAAIAVDPIRGTALPLPVAHARALERHLHGIRDADGAAIAARLRMPRAAGQTGKERAA